jgi:hypothetical protein
MRITRIVKNMGEKRQGDKGMTGRKGVGDENMKEIISH